MTDLSGVLDASFMIRYLTGQPPKTANLAREMIDSNLQLRVTDVGIVETAYVLTTVYRVSRAAVVDALAALVQRRNIISLGAEKEYMILGLLMCRKSARISFGDALIWAAARSRKVSVVYTFDERFPSDGITRKP
ncbi:MAG: PIN domain-containing protein [Armatimonadota bacterium]